VWIERLGWEALINRKGTTWRRLGDKQQAAVQDGASARALMRAEPSVICRPVVEWSDGATSIGFEPADWQKRS
jgi:arsenate reductase-like glutaredoxin family protein